MRMPRRRNHTRVRWRNAAQAGASSAGEDLGIGEPRRVVNRDMQILPADAPRAAAAIAVNAMTNPDDPAEPLQIDVQQVADLCPLIPLHRRRGLEQHDPD